MSIRTKRVDDTSSAADGYRALIDRLWPRGLSKDGGSTACRSVRG